MDQVEAFMLMCKMEKLEPGDLSLEQLDGFLVLCTNSKDFTASSAIFS